LYAAGFSPDFSSFAPRCAGSGEHALSNALVRTGAALAGVAIERHWPKKARGPLAPR